MKIGVIGSHWAATACIMEVHRRGMLAGVCIPNVQHDGTMQIQGLASQLGAPLAGIRREFVAEDLEMWLSRVRPDAVFVVGFPYIIPDEAVDMVPRGMFNVHFGLLPKYRGPDPVFWELRNGESIGGVTVHRVVEAMDAGPIAHQASIPIDSTDTYGSHTSRLVMITPNIVGHIIDRLSIGDDLPGKPQDETVASAQHRAELEDIRIDWSSMDANAVANLVRACNPAYGGAAAYLRGMPLRPLQAADTGVTGTGVPGTVTAVDETGIEVACLGGTLVRLEVLNIQEGTFTAKRFADIFGIEPGEVFQTADHLSAVSV